MSYTVERKEAIVYKVRLSPMGWARIYIEEWKGGGSFSCISDYGNYNYIWNAIGSETLREFLCRLDYGFFMSKAHSSRSGVEFSTTEAVKVIKEDILRWRREDISADDARNLWEYIEGVDTCLNYDLFCAFMADSPFCPNFYDYIDIPHITRKIPECQGFWENVWPAICQHWKEELAEDYCAMSMRTIDKSEW